MKLEKYQGHLESLRCPKLVEIKDTVRLSFVEVLSSAINCLATASMDRALSDSWATCENGGDCTSPRTLSNLSGEKAHQKHLFRAGTRDTRNATA